MSLAWHISITNLRRQYTSVRDCSDEESCLRKSTRDRSAAARYDLDGAEDLWFVSSRPGSLSLLGWLSRGVGHPYRAGDCCLCAGAQLGNTPYSRCCILGLSLRFPLVLSAVPDFLLAHAGAALRGGILVHPILLKKAPIL